MTEDVPVEGNIVPPIFAEGVKHAFGVDLADLARESRPPRDSLADFLLARIADDEADLQVEQVETTTYADLARGERTFVPGRPLSVPDRRRLAEIEAKRRIVEMHTEDAGRREPGEEPLCPACIVDPDDWPWTRQSEPCATLRLLALPYADHPDFREEWRP